MFQCTSLSRAWPPLKIYTGCNVTESGRLKALNPQRLASLFDFQPIHPQRVKADCVR